MPCHLGVILATSVCLFLTGCGKEKTAANATASRATKASGASGAKPEDRFRWNFKTLTEAYLEHGHRDAAWDEFATNALTQFARYRSGLVVSDGLESDEVARNSRQALARGCADPMVLYLHARFVLAFQEETAPNELADAYRKSAAAVNTAPCPPIRKFYIYLRGSEALNAGRGGKADLPQIHSLRRGAAYALQLALEDETMPVAEAYDAMRDLLTSVNNNSAEAAEFSQRINPLLLARWPNEPLILLLQGSGLIEEAWRARGNATATAVTPEGWEGFRRLLAQASSSLEKAWQLDSSEPRIASEMLRVELGEGKGRERLELWFGRAMALNTNFYEACYRKLYYLEPKWYGSTEAMLAFGRECVESTRWGGTVPLTLVDAHYSLAAQANENGNTNYYKNPQVWTDIQSAYEKYFTLNPNDAYRRRNYAWYAYACEQWNVFNKQLPLMGQTNFAFFGGKETFERMVKLAQEKTAARNN
jgi:hypothetical protein